MSFTCTKCDKVLSSSWGYKLHIQNGCSTKGSYLKCPDCKKSFSSIKQITKHLESHGFIPDTTELVEIRTEQGNYIEDYIIRPLVN